MNNKKIHHLKTKVSHFTAVSSGEKKAELRKNDRNFSVGDTLILFEIDVLGNYTGKQVNVRITHILKSVEYLQPGYCMLSIEKIYSGNNVAIKGV